MTFKLLSPTGVLAQIDCDRVTLPTQDGQITVLPHHAPLYSLVNAGEAIVWQNSKHISYAVGHGFAQITGESVTILVDFGINAADIQEEQIKAAKLKAEQNLKTYQTEYELAQAQTDLLRSILQLKIASKRRSS